MRDNTTTLLRDVGIAHWTDEDNETITEIAEQINAGHNWRLKILLHRLRGEKRRAEMARHPNTAPVSL